MEDLKDKQIVQRIIDNSLSGIQDDPWMAQRVLNTAHQTQRTGGIVVKKKLSIGFVLLLVFMFVSLTALAVALLTGTQIIELFAVPIAQENDGEDYTQESYTHDELVRLIQTLNENGITLDEDSRIMKALKNGQGYWEEDVLREICEQAFGGPINQWTIEEKHWFEEMRVKIGFAEYNCYIVPGDDDMTTGEARTYAANKLNEAYGADLPDASDNTWRIEEWFFQYRDENGNPQPARWQFEYVNKNTDLGEYIIEFTRDGEVVDISESSSHGEITK